jgi:perosamine synthetase
MASKSIQLFKPYFGEEEIEALKQPFKSGWIGLGPKTSEFEKKFAEYIGVKYAVGVNSCTAALDLALRLLGIRHQDEVIVPTMTFVSTAHVVAYNLATPIFADVDENCLTLDLKDVRRKITDRTKAIIPVHYSGRPCDMDALKEIAGSKIAIIEDAAHACGAEYKGKKCGSLGDIGCFSFHAVKNLAMGDGGALTLNNQQMYERAKRMRWLGISKGTWDRTKLDRSYWWEYSVDEIGLKCHMNDIQAAIGLVQLGKLASMNMRRKEIVEMYTEGLKSLDGIETPPEDNEDYKSSWHIYCIRCNSRNDLSAYLEKNGIGTGVHYKPIHTYPCYGNKPSLPVAERVFKRILSLPMHPGLSDGDVKRIIEVTRSFK